MLFLGIDVGGTKTHALLADEAGAVQAVGRAGAGNWESVGLEGAYETLQQAVGQALARASATPAEVTAAGYGLAGLDWPSDEGRLRPIVARLGVGGPQVMVNDSFVALRAGAPWGVVVEAGTGTTVAGRSRNGKTARTLGRGDPFDDWGSAPDLADACVLAVSRAYTGRGAATSLTDRLIHLTGARDHAAVLEGLSRGPYDIGELIAEVVQALFEEAQAGDAAAVDIVRRAGGELGGGAVAVIRRLGMEEQAFNVVLAGGLFRSHSPLLLETLSDRIHAVAPGARLSRLDAPPVVGGVLLAMDAIDLEVTTDVHRRLKEEARRVLSSSADGP